MSAPNARTPEQPAAPNRETPNNPRPATRRRVGLLWWIVGGVVVLVLGITVFRALWSDSEDAQTANNTNGGNTVTMTDAQFKELLGKANGQTNTAAAPGPVHTIQQGPVPVNQSDLARIDFSNIQQGWQAIPSADGKTALVYEVRYVRTTDMSVLLGSLNR